MQNHSSSLLFLCVLGFLTSFNFCCGSTGGGYGNRSCIDSEKQALLLLKNSLVDDLNYLSSWVGDDCCAWHGIGCNHRTGHVTELDLRNGGLRGDQIHPSLVDLKYLTYLDLSVNKFYEIRIPEYFGSFKDLIYLDLSASSFKGLVPHHLGNLSRLRYLDLKNNRQLTIDSTGWLPKLPLLEHLDLSYVNLSGAMDWFPAINMLPNSVLVLKLSGCQLYNNINRDLYFMNLTSLVSLDLGSNRLNSSFPLWVFNNSGLEYLNLGANNFYGSVPESIGRLKSLVELSLTYNNFYGTIPGSIGGLTSLSSLDLYHNNFEGSIQESIGRLTYLTYLNLGFNKFQGLIPKSIGNLTALSTLVLLYNNFQGMVPQSIGNMPSLSLLSLSNNKITDPIPPEMGNLTKLTVLNIGSNDVRNCLPEAFCQLTKLETLDVSGNHMSGSIPKCIGELSNLKSLELSANSWNGSVSEHHFVNLTNLITLVISSKSNLVFNVSSKWVPPFQLRNIDIKSLKVGSKFPRWLLTQRHIENLRMSNTSISDTIPADWFMSVLLSHANNVDLSHNDIYGEHLSLASATPNGLRTLVLSNNLLSGKFPAFLCNLTSLRILVLSNNKFSGELPGWLGDLTELAALDVMNNRLSGDIPISVGSLRALTFLNLHNNKFQGKLPVSFKNLRLLVTLDVGKNNLTDTLPSWTVEHLPYLKYLVLKSNNFHGGIPTQLCHHSLIQLLNLAENEITGNIPSCFGNFSAMITSKIDDDIMMYDDQGIIDNVKGYELKYTSTIWFLFSIDLSDNKISGKIPEELMNLRGLLNLNLAGNHLVGRIPDIGKLEKLESLDLSRNKLYGSIPQSLSNLNFLSRLNLSFNDLSGRVPTGNQLQTLNDPSIYAGNNQLCGRPILKPCIGDLESHDVHDYNEVDPDDERLWFYAGIGPGILVGFLGFCASLHFINSWRYSYFHFVEHVIDKIAADIALLWRKFYK